MGSRISSKVTSRLTVLTLAIDPVEVKQGIACSPVKFTSIHVVPLVGKVNGHLNHPVVMIDDDVVEARQAHMDSALGGHGSFLLSNVVGINEPRGQRLQHVIQHLVITHGTCVENRIK